MLTLPQLDNIVHSTLQSFKGFEIGRRKKDRTIFYDVHEHQESAKRFIGTYRVWEWHDGSSRCGWMPLDTDDSYIVRMRNLVWEAITANTAPANLSTEQDAP